MKPSALFPWLVAVTAVRGGSGRDRADAPKPCNDHAAPIQPPRSPSGAASSSAASRGRVPPPTARRASCDPALPATTAATTTLPGIGRRCKPWPSDPPICDTSRIRREPDRAGDAGCDAGAVRRRVEGRRAARIVVGGGQRTSCVDCSGGAVSSRWYDVRRAFTV